MTLTEGEVASAASPNNMPPLLKAEREALTVSIQRFGVVVPAIDDQSGDTIDGFNRKAIATELGIECPVIIRECTLEERDALRIELNAARRQLPPEKWQPMVDHLQELGRYSDRVVAKAVGVPRTTVQRHRKTKEKEKEKEKEEVPIPTGPSGPVGIRQVRAGEDSKQRAVPGEESYSDRIIRLVRTSTTGLTVSELRTDEVLSQSGSGTVGKRCSDLVKEGVFEATGGQRNRRYRFRQDAQPSQPKDAQSSRSNGKNRQEAALDKKVEKLSDLIGDKEVRERYKSSLAVKTATREYRSIMREYEKEIEAERVEQEQEVIEVAKVARNQILKRISYWTDLLKQFDGFHMTIGVYIREFDNLPRPTRDALFLLDQAMEETRKRLDALASRLYPGGKNRLSEGTIIDIK